MESTGDYAIILYNILTEAGINAYLGNARSVKGVQGKETDVCDAQSLQKPHTAGPLRKSFGPAPVIVPLGFPHAAPFLDGRSAANQLLLMQKSLAEMNINVQHVSCDTDGDSATALIVAILAGERDPRGVRCPARQTLS